MPASQCPHEGQNERAWVKVPAAVLVHRRPSFLELWPLYTLPELLSHLRWRGEGGVVGPLDTALGLLPAFHV